MAFTRTFIAATLSLAALGGSALAESAHETATPPSYRWSFAGPFGRYDQGQLQRGFKVYREVCLQCHGMQLLSFRNLAEPGGPGFTTAQAAAVAAEYKYPDGVERPGRDDRARRAYRRPLPAAVAEHLPRAPMADAPPDLSVHRQGARLRARLSRVR